MNSVVTSITKTDADVDGSHARDWRKMHALPNTQLALKVLGPKQIKLTEGCPLPIAEKDEILVHVKCVAVNPVDAKTLDMAPNVGSTAGCEFAGDVVRVGPSVKNQRLKEGVAVFGVIRGNSCDRPENGAWSEYVAVAGDLVYLLPPHLTYQEGASMGAALATVGMALFFSWDLPRPYEVSEAQSNSNYYDRRSGPGSGDQKKLTAPQDDRGPARGPGAKQYVLVYGGSTTCGAMALQMLRISGLVPVCTSSPKNFGLVKSFGAEEAFDYHSHSCADDIRRYTNNSLAYVLDCITSLESMRICYAAMGHIGGQYMGLDPVPLRAHTRREIKPDYVLVYTMFGQKVTAPRPFGRPARAKDRAFGEIWTKGTQALVDTPGKLLPHPHDQGSKGLHGVIDGLDRMRKGQVSGVKLVFESS
jgi:aspyridone synthetase trans-acting enoyl reductase